ncbi:MAG: hypothetical protein H7123_06175 [Thermoleophilia bacterium]|nr:hypothetical protein [Thermoleophilia bacterium]
MGVGTGAQAAPAQSAAGGSSVSPQQRAAAARVIGLLTAQQRAAEARLDAARKVVVTTGLEAQRLRARAAELVVARAHLTRLLSALPASSNHVIALDAAHSPFASTSSRADAAATTAEHAAEVSTRAAAVEQALVTERSRQASAVSAAVSALENNVHTGLGEFPAHGWGGAGTAAVTPASLDSYLESKASPIAGHGTDLLRSGVRWNIDPRLIVAIAGAESLFGLVTCAPYNGWGYGCPDGPVVFTSWGQGIDAVAKGLRTNYLDQGRTTVERIHLKYAPPAAANDPTGLNYAWPNNVSRFLLEQGGNPGNVEGPGASAASAGSS